jgi:hypothetical protein
MCLDVIVVYTPTNPTPPSHRVGGGGVVAAFKTCRQLLQISMEMARVRSQNSRIAGIH